MPAFDDGLAETELPTAATVETDVLIVGSGPAGGAAAKVSEGLSVPLKTVIIGPGREVTDLYYDWARLREVEEDGVLLIRPDKFIGWRSMTLPADPEQALRAALENLLSRQGTR
jgi:2,4-dichlorophenol 6-monooxygenase